MKQYKNKYDIETINHVNKSVDLVEYIGQYVNLIYKNGEYWCNCPLHKDDITPSFSINKEKNVFKCLGCHVGGTPIVFVQHYHKLSFPKAIEHLIEYADITVIQKENSDIFDFLQRTKRNGKIIEKVERTYLPESCINKYGKEPVREWLVEGVAQEVLDKYQVRYDKTIRNGKMENRIVFPVRDEQGRIISIKGRTLYENYAELGVPKFIYYDKIITNDFLFGLYQNKKNILREGECIVFEAEKGVMKLVSWGFGNAVALCTNNISPEQTNLLLGLKCDLVFSFDKDVPRKSVVSKLRDISLFTNVYFTYDKNNLLSGKESAYDRGLDVWNQLYSEKEVVTY